MVNTSAVVESAEHFILNCCMQSRRHLHLLHSLAKHVGIPLWKEHCQEHPCYDMNHSDNNEKGFEDEMIESIEHEQHTLEEFLSTPGSNSMLETPTFQHYDKGYNKKQQASDVTEHVEEYKHTSNKMPLSAIEASSDCVAADGINPVEEEVDTTYNEEFLARIRRSLGCELQAELSSEGQQALELGVLT